MVSPTLKSYLFTLVFTTDDVDDNGKPIPRTSFPKDIYRGCSALRKLLVEQCEAGFLPNEKEPKDSKMEDVTWKPAGESVEGSRIVLERFKDDDVDFTPQMKDAVSYYFKASKELPPLPEEVLGELESIFGLKV